LKNLQKKAKREQADSTITCIKQRISKHDFLMSYPGAEIKLFQKYIENMPYYREPYPLIQDTIFKTPVDSIFITKKELAM